jgi:hypothetical protein
MRKNVTLSAEESLIERARDKARKQRTTLNALFREWLSSGASRKRSTPATVSAWTISVWRPLTARPRSRVDSGGVPIARGPRDR